MKKHLSLILLALLVWASPLLKAQHDHDEEYCGLDKRLKELMAEDPVFKSQMEKAKKQMELETEEFLKEKKDLKAATYIIPVVFHIIHANGAENLPLSTIQQGISIMNEDYSGQYANANLSSILSSFQGIRAGDCSIEFRLAQIDPWGNSTDGVTRTYNSSWTNDGFYYEYDYKTQLQWDRSKYLNIYVVKNCNASNTSGMAYYPYSTTGSYAYLDGIIAASWAVSRNYGYSVLSHEAGHWLNLIHTWGDGGCSVDDGVSDTPLGDSYNSVNCLTQVTRCGYLQNVSNYMDYAYCEMMFTQGQKSRMLAAITSSTASRNNLWTAANLAATGVDGGGGSDTQAPTTPTSLSASGITQSSVTLSWNASSDNVGVSGYDVYQGTSTVVGTTSSTSFNVTGLSANTTYTFYVRAKDAAGNVSGWSNAATATTQSGGGSYCASQGSSSTYEWIAGVQIGSFSNTSGAAGYTDFTGQTVSVGTGSNSVTLTPGFSGSTYSEFWKIWIDLNENNTFDSNEEVFSGSGTSTVNGSMNVPSGYSGVTTRMRITMKYNAAPTACETFSYGEVEDYTVTISGGTTDTQAPTTPGGLTASNVTASSVSLSWNASSDNVGVTGYDVYNGSTLVGTASSTSYNVTGLSANTTYTFYVRAKDAAGNISNWSNAATATTQSTSDTQPPTTPTNLTASNITSSSVTLSWNASSDNVGVTGYDIYRSSTFVATATSTSYTVSGLSANTTYSFTVYAKDAAGNESAASNAVSVTTTGTTPPATYCSSQSNNQTYEWIAGVQIGSFSNTSDKSAYTDYTNQTVSLSAGSNVSLVLTPGFRPNEPYNEAWAIWIDYNKNGSFDDTGERVFTGSGSTAISGNFTVSSSATGSTRMRVSMRYNTTPVSCGSFDYGEVEDYTVSFGAAGATTPSDTEVDVVVYPNPNDGNFTMVIPGGITGKVIINIFDMTGQLVFQQMIELTGEPMEVPVSLNIPAGVYAVQVTTGDRVFTQQIVVK